MPLASPEQSSKSLQNFGRTLHSKIKPQELKMLNTNTHTQDIQSNINELDENTKNVFFMLRDMPETELKKLLWKLRFLNVIGNFFIVLCWGIATTGLYFLTLESLGTFGFFTWLPFNKTFLIANLILKYPVSILPIFLFILLISMFFSLGYVLKKIHSIRSKKMLTYTAYFFICFSSLGLYSFYFLETHGLRQAAASFLVFSLFFFIYVIHLIKTPCLFGEHCPNIEQIKFFTSKNIAEGNKKFPFCRISKGKTDNIAIGLAIACLAIFFSLSIGLYIYTFVYDSEQRSSLISYREYETSIQKLLFEGEEEYSAMNYASALKCFKDLSYKADNYSDRGRFIRSKANTKLAYCYLNGIGTKISHSKAVSYLKDIQDTPQALYLIGTMFYHGYGVEQDFAEAAKCFQKAAQGGCEEAKILLSCKNELPPYKNVSFEEFLRQKYYGAFPKAPQPESTKEKDSKKAELEPRKEKDCKIDLSQHNKE